MIAGVLHLLRIVSPLMVCLHKEILTLFIPTTPNPTSGYVFVVPEDEVKYLDMTVDEAVKFVISLGTIDGIGHKIKPTP